MKPSPLARRMKEVMEAHGLNAARWSKRAGISQNLLYELYSGRTKTMAHETLMKLSSAIGMTVSELVGEKVENISVVDKKRAKITPSASLQRIRVIGDVQAGAWMDALERSYDEPIKIEQHVPSHYRNRVFGLRVLGQSMNLKFSEGTLLTCILSSEYGQPIQSKDYVIMLRRKDSPQIEATVKRYMIEGKKHYLCTQSDDPRFQERFELPAPLSNPLLQKDDIWIHAIVLSYFEELPARRR